VTILSKTKLHAHTELHTILDLALRQRRKKQILYSFLLPFYSSLHYICQNKHLFSSLLSKCVPFILFNVHILNRGWEEQRRHGLKECNLRHEKLVLFDTIWCYIDLVGSYSHIFCSVGLVNLIKYSAKKSRKPNILNNVLLCYKSLQLCTPCRELSIKYMLNNT